MLADNGLAVTLQARFLTAGENGGSMRHVKMTTEEISAVFSSLANLLHSGIGVADALSLMVEDETGPYAKRLADMAKAMDAGDTLASACRQVGEFPTYACNLLEVGEQTGRTEQTLQALARHYSSRADMTRRLRSALLYPTALLAVLVAVVMILLVWVLPVFNEVYAQLGSSLTGVAGSLLVLGTVLRRAMPVICILVVLTAAALAGGLLIPQVKRCFLRIGQAFPAKRGVLYRLYTARFLQALAMGLCSGLTGEAAIEQAAILSAQNDVLSARCRTAQRFMENGMSLAHALRESGLLNKRDGRLLEAGIRSGNGEVVMEQIANRLLQQSEWDLEQQVSRIEPAVVVFMSLLVGAILLSVMLPLMHIMSAIG